MSETVVRLGAERNLVGIVTEPTSEASCLQPVSVVLLNSGWVHRVGPHRMNVRIARRLARSGFVSIRFDFSGIGDSGNRKDNLPLEQAMPEETQGAMEYLERAYDSRSFVLIGNCSGGAVAYRTSVLDQRVAGAVLMNPNVYDTSAEMNQYLKQRGMADYYLRDAVRDPKRWAKFFTGRSPYRRIFKTVVRRARQALSGDETTTGVADKVSGEIEGLRDRGCELLFLFAQGDFALETLHQLVERQRPELTTTAPSCKHILQRADHLCTTTGAQQELLSTIDEWMQRFSVSRAQQAS